MECTYQSSSSSFSPGNGRVGLITRLSKEKGIEEVCSILPDESIIWGDGPLLEQLKDRYTNLKFPGVCQDVNEALNKIDIFVFSSAWGVWGISLLEAICARNALFILGMKIGTIYSQKLHTVLVTKMKYKFI